MKKILFTLAALCAFGFAGAQQQPQSQPAPELGFRLNGEAINEVTMAPGDQLEVTITIEKMYMTMVSGMQAQWRMFDAEHAPILYDNTSKVNPGKVYGSRVKNWFNAIDHGTSAYNEGLNIGSATPGQGDDANKYRIMATNTQTNMSFFRYDDVTGEEMFAQNIGVFTLVANENWDEEFATFELDLDYTLWNQCPDYDYNVFEEAWNTIPMILTIKNSAYEEPIPEPVDLTGEILIGDADEDGYVAISYTGEEEGLTITAMIDGVPVEIVDGKIFLGAYGEAVVTVTVEGEGYNPMTAEKTVNWEQPAPEVTEAPVITYETTDDAVIITATGNGNVTLYINNELVENPCTIARGETATAVLATAYAQEEGKEMSAAATLEVPIPAIEVPEPETTATPVITVDVQDDVVIITATGDGEVLLYIDGELVENPATITRGNADQVVVVTATAQEEGKLISDEASMDVTIPAVAGVEPGDEHATGYWLVTIDKDGNEIWDPMVTGADNDGYQTNVALTYGVYGGFDIAAGAERPNVPFYVVIDGVRYACDIDGTVPEWGDANQNPLYENDNFWAIPVGYKYVIGVVYDAINGGYYLQISRGTFVGVDELNADKAVAGVRYFNMAGQEMQEANGMTIVVTTYTDGTTSAEKVMK